MIIYVPVSSTNPKADAIGILESQPIETLEDGRRKWYEAHSRPGFVVECYEDGDNIVWSFDEVGPVTPANTLPVNFSC